MEKQQDKQKLTVEGQVQDMKEKDIKFEICSEEDAKKFLQYNNYYFKIKSYARNYNMNSQTKKYFNLDFAYLVELSKLDMYIRKIILEIIFLETNKSKKLILQGLHRGQKVVGCVGFQIVCNMNINDVYRTFSEKSGNVLFN